MTAVAAVVTAWGVLALIVALVFGIMSLRKARKFKVLLVVALALAGVALALVVIASLAAFMATT